MSVGIDHIAIREQNVRPTDHSEKTPVLRINSLHGIRHSLLLAADVDPYERLACEEYVRAGIAASDPRNAIRQLEVTVPKNGGVFSVGGRAV